jgi:hypothetical protein
MTFDPTPEQAAIVAAYSTGQNLVIQAGAGTGKTSTLRLIAEADPSRRGTYIAFNRAIADEAKRSFPSNIKAGTAHSLAFQAVGKNFSHRLNAPRQWPRETARLLGLNPMSMKVYGDEQKTFSAAGLSRIVMDAVASFCRSAATEVGREHFAVIAGLDEPGPRGPRRGPVFDRLVDMLLPYAQKAWADLQQQNGVLRFTHDHYLKMYQLSNPKIAGDFLLFDEAQDANPVIAAIVEAQSHLQIILVGDSSQAIYGFTGAVDAMRKFADKGTEVRTLSQSFRFGPAVADVANVFLDALDAPLRIVGFDKVPSREDVLDVPGKGTADAVLCRTNAGCLAELIVAQEQGRKAALVGGTTESVKFVEAARDLKMGKGTEHPDLAAFTSWQMVEQYVSEEETTGDLATMVKLIAAHGVERLLSVLRAAGDERNAEVIISTAHKSKGREWDAVRIADFALDVDKVNPADLMLAYVAVTRAKVTLDVGSLGEWIEEHKGLAADLAEIAAEAIVEEEIDAIRAEERDAIDGMVEVEPVLMAVAALPGNETVQHVVVDVTDPANPKRGIRYTFADDCTRWIAEHGVEGRTYAVGTFTITESPVTLL